jgi:CBS domain-containing protein
MAMQGVPAGGFKKVGQLLGTNMLSFRTDQSAEEITVELLASHFSGAPVVNADGRLAGFISEFDILRAYETHGGLSGLKGSDIMTRDPITVSESTDIAEALRIMKENHWLTLPVEKDGVVQHSVTRHDLLRAYIGIGLGTEAH